MLNLGNENLSSCILRLKEKIRSWTTQIEINHSDAGPATPSPLANLFYSPFSPSKNSAHQLLWAWFPPPYTFNRFSHFSYYLITRGGFTYSKYKRSNLLVYRDVFPKIKGRQPNFQDLLLSIHYLLYEFQVIGGKFFHGPFELSIIVSAT